MAMCWYTKGELGTQLVGFLPNMLSEDDPRPAREQLHQGYAHGGGWQPFGGFTWDPEKQQLRYPGDPPLSVMAFVELREEMILVYDHGLVMILQKSGEYEVARMD